MIQGPQFLKIGGPLGPHFKILDPSLHILYNTVRRYFKIIVLCLQLI